MADVLVTAFANIDAGTLLPATVGWTPSPLYALSVQVGSRATSMQVSEFTRHRSPIGAVASSRPGLSLSSLSVGYMKITTFRSLETLEISVLKRCN